MGRLIAVFCIKYWHLEKSTMRSGPAPSSPPAKYDVTLVIVRGFKHVSRFLWSFCGRAVSVWCVLTSRNTQRAIGDPLGPHKYGMYNMILPKIADDIVPVLVQWATIGVPHA